MVAIVQIISENVGEFGLDAGDRVSWNGITAEWKGASFQVTSMNAAARTNYPNVQVNKPLPRQFRGALVNAMRNTKGLPRIDFDGGGNVRGTINNNPSGSSTPDSTTPRPNSRLNVMQMDPDDLFDYDDLSRTERYQLRDNGSIERNGVTYTRADINAMGQRLGNIRTRRSERFESERRPTRDDYDTSKRAIRKFGTHGILGTLLSFGSGAGAFSTFRQAMIDADTVTDRRIAEIEANTELSEEQKNEQITLALEAFYQTQSEIFIVNLIPASLMLYGAIRNVPRAVGIIIRSIRLAIQAGAQGASIFGGPVAFLGTLAINAAIFVLTEIGMYFAIRWAMRTDTGQAILFGFVQSQLVDQATEILGPFAANVNARIEELVAPVMDQIQSGAADGIEFANDIIYSDELERRGGREAAERMRQEWDNINSSNRSVRAPNQDAETFSPPAFP